MLLYRVTVISAVTPSRRIILLVHVARPLLEIVRAMEQLATWSKRYGVVSEKAACTGTTDAIRITANSRDKSLERVFLHVWFSFVYPDIQYLNCNRRTFCIRNPLEDKRLFVVLMRVHLYRQRFSYFGPCRRCQTRQQLLLKENLRQCRWFCFLPVLSAQIPVWVKAEN